MLNTMDSIYALKVITNFKIIVLYKIENIRLHNICVRLKSTITLRFIFCHVLFNIHNRKTKKQKQITLLN